ncbi:MAG: aryl-sulfate sulfotransferase [Phycisphaerae bacterium]
MRTNALIACGITATVIAAVVALGQAGGEKRGVIKRDAGATPGFVLLAPLRSLETHLVADDGRIVHSWKDTATPGSSVQLMPNGDLYRASRADKRSSFDGGGFGGVIRRFSWEGKLLWEFDCSSDEHWQHHDFEIMPNGNILLIAWEKKTRDDALAAGRKPELCGEQGIWPDHVIEVKPTGDRGGEIVWSWHAWDHLIQDIDPAKPNYGKVSDDPGRIDLNFVVGGPMMPPAEHTRLRQLGYVGSGGEEEVDEPGPPGDRPGPRDRNPRTQPDWMHTNSIDYNADLDQVLLSVHNFHEVWVIDHSTTREEARTDRGGESGKGGRILYRWGNPAAYKSGTPTDQKHFGQHDAQWIAAGSPGAGNILIFNNGAGRRDGRFSSIEEITPPLSNGNYVREGAAFGPKSPTWQYTADPRAAFFSGHISGAARLASGNTLICSGEQGRVFEVTAGGQIVWEYLSPLGGEVQMGPPGGPGGHGGPGGPNRDRDEKHALFRVLHYSPAFVEAIEAKRR